MNTSALLTLDDFESAARAALNDASWSYLAGGAGTEATVADNAKAFSRVWLTPRMLDAVVDEPDTVVELFGQRIRFPVLLAPTSPQRLFHEDAELASVRAASHAETVAIVSTDSHFGFPDICRAAPGRCWFQLYAYASRTHVERTIDMAIEAGATALVITVDAQHAALRISAQRAGFHTPGFVDYGNLRRLGVLEGSAPAEGRIARLPLTWRDLSWIRQRSGIPLLVKGVLHPVDARNCVEAGVDGLIVSNHGGRQLDCVVPSLVALQAIADAIPQGTPLLMDGGIRSGVDVVKALACGAKAVCVGRPQLWGLALEGQAGVFAVLTLLRREICDALRQLGIPSVSQLNRDIVIPSSP